MNGVNSHSFNKIESKHLYNIISAPCTCPNPAPIQFGSQFPAIGPYSCGSQISFNCNSGYNLVGTRSMTCNFNRQWSGFVPFCHRQPGMLRCSAHLYCEIGVIACTVHRVPHSFINEAVINTLSGVMSWCWHLQNNCSCSMAPKTLQLHTSFVRFAQLCHSSTVTLYSSIEAPSGGSEYYLRSCRPWLNMFLRPALELLRFSPVTACTSASQNIILLQNTFCLWVYFWFPAGNPLFALLSLEWSSWWWNI